MSRALEDGDLEATGQRISLRCVLMQHRIRQAVRLDGCEHATAFCAEALGKANKVRQPFTSKWTKLACGGKSLPRTLLDSPHAQ